MTIDLLPDVALLEIFEYYVDPQGPQDESFSGLDTWHTLVHVCQRWRNVIFGSPRRLDLQILCTDKKPVREMLDIWPVLPLVVLGYHPTSVDSIIAALEHNDRVYKVHFGSSESSQVEEVLLAMQRPFPALTHLWLEADDEVDETLPVVPDSFLGGSAPGLRTLWLCNLPFPGLPKLLLSATQLDELNFLNLSYSGYISPDVMATCLSTLTRLGSLQLVFPFHPSQSRPPPRTRSVFHSLTFFGFSGDSEYLEDLVAWFDAPLLTTLSIVFFRQIVFNTPRLTQFIGRAQRLNVLDEASVVLLDRAVSIQLSSSSQIFDELSGIPSSTTQLPGGGELKLKIGCGESARQLSSLARDCASFLPVHSVEHLYFRNGASESLHWQDTENTDWLGYFLYPFTAVKSLYLIRELAPSFVRALLGERATEVLPALRNIFFEELQLLSGPNREVIGQFVAARQLINQPIAVSNWE